jgi:hypothetical protein
LEKVLLQGVMKNIYVSTDVKTDSPIPGPHSMLNLGSAAYLLDKTLVSTFSAILSPYPAPPETHRGYRRHNAGFCQGLSRALLQAKLIFDHP